MENGGDRTIKFDMNNKDLIVKIKEMVYNGNFDGCEVLASGDIDGHLFSVRSYGSHPCCYVSVPIGQSLNIDDISCHGGITYHGDHLPKEEQDDKNWWIGWDYTHSEDYIDVTFNGVHYRDYGKKWTTQEMIDECLKVIKELKFITMEEPISVQETL